MDGPLSEHDFNVLARVGERSRALRRASALSTTNGSSLLVCAFATLLCAPFYPWLLCTALVLGASGFAELRGGRMLRKLDLRAPRWLAINQLALLGVIAIYCGVQIASGLRASSGLQDVTGAYPDLAGPTHDALQSIGVGADTVDSLYRGALVVFYGAVFGVSALYQGGCAYYYAKRGALLRAQRREAPA